MLYWLSALSDGGDVFNLFRYITFRAGGAFFTALIFGFLFGRPLINLLRVRQKKGQPIRDDGPQSHFAKAGTPTMGGRADPRRACWSRRCSGRGSTMSMSGWCCSSPSASALIGFADDWKKVTKNNTKGVSEPGPLRARPRHRGGGGLCATRVQPAELADRLALPFFKNVLLNLGLFYHALRDDRDRRRRPTR